jgi:hypothetical protein
MSILAILCVCVVALVLLVWLICTELVYWIAFLPLRLLFYFSRTKIVASEKVVRNIGWLIVGFSFLGCIIGKSFGYPLATSSSLVLPFTVLYAAILRQGYSYKNNDGRKPMKKSTTIQTKTIKTTMSNTNMSNYVAEKVTEAGNAIKETFTAVITTTSNCSYLF